MTRMDYKDKFTSTLPSEYVKKKGAWPYCRRGSVLVESCSHAVESLLFSPSCQVFCVWVFWAKNFK